MNKYLSFRQILFQLKSRTFHVSWIFYSIWLTNTLLCQISFFAFELKVHNSCSKMAVSALSECCYRRENERKKVSFKWKAIRKVSFFLTWESCSNFRSSSMISFFIFFHQHIWLFFHEVISEWFVFLLLPFCCTSRFWCCFALSFAMFYCVEWDGIAAGTCFTLGNCLKLLTTQDIQIDFFFSQEHFHLFVILNVWMSVRFRL